jgi:hypothetical protein
MILDESIIFKKVSPVSKILFFIYFFKVARDFNDKQDHSSDRLWSALLPRSSGSKFNDYFPQIPLWCNESFLHACINTALAQSYGFYMLLSYLWFLVIFISNEDYLFICILFSALE